MAQKRMIVDFFSNFKPLKFGHGEIILRPDFINPGVFFIEKGYVKVYSVTDDGDLKIHLIFKPGEIFPLLWVFKGVDRKVYYESLGDVLLRRAKKEEFLKFAKGNLGVLLELVDEMMTVTNVYVSRIDTLEYTKSYPRLISRIIELAHRFGRRVDGKILIDVPLTHSDIAASANMTRETASREIEALLKKKLIGYSSGKITVASIAKLRRELAAHSVREAL